MANPQDEEDRKDPWKWFTNRSENLRKLSGFRPAGAPPAGVETAYYEFAEAATSLVIKTVQESIASYVETAKNDRAQQERDRKTMRYLTWVIAAAAITQATAAAWTAVRPPPPIVVPAPVVSPVVIPAPVVNLSPVLALPPEATVTRPKR